MFDVSFFCRFRDGEDPPIATVTNERGERTVIRKAAVVSLAYCGLFLCGCSEGFPDEVEVREICETHFDIVRERDDFSLDYSFNVFFEHSLREDLDAQPNVEISHMDILGLMRGRVEGRTLNRVRGGCARLSGTSFASLQRPVCFGETELLVFVEKVLPEVCGHQPFCASSEAAEIISNSLNELAQEVRSRPAFDGYEQSFYLISIPSETTQIPRITVHNASNLAVEHGHIIVDRFEVSIVGNGIDMPLISVIVPRAFTDTSAGQSYSCWDNRYRREINEAVESGQ